MKHVIDPEGQRLPIKIDTTSNGEFVPVPLSPANLAGNRLAHEAVCVNAKRLGMSRRDFLRFGVRCGDYVARIQRGQRGSAKVGWILRHRI